MTARVVLSFWVYFCLFANTVESNPDPEPLICSVNACLPADYDGTEFPYTNQTNIVSVGFMINGVFSVEEIDSSVSFGVFAMITWKDPRIQINATNLDDVSSLGREISSKVWTPSLFIYQVKNVKVTQVESQSQEQYIQLNGTELLYIKVLKLTVSCEMNFTAYPLDNHVCNVRVGSFYNPENQVTFKQLFSPRVITLDKTLADYSYNIAELPEQLWIHKGVVDGANFSITGFQIQLKRRIFQYICSYYLPTCLFIIVSWVSFLIPPDVIPGRMTLLVTLFLVMVNIFNTVNAKAPPANGLTAISAWLLTCILFIFGALLAYAFILYKMRKLKDSFSKAGTLIQELQKYDNAFLFTFPGLFIAFNAIYWPLALNG